MPIEIKEIIIRAEVKELEEGGATAGKAPQASIEDIVEECVEQVMRIIRDMKER